MSRSSHEAAAVHEANVTISFELAVDAPERAPHFYLCHRDGEKKRVFDSPTPEHYFHLQYQLLPAERVGEEEGGRGVVSKSDVVTFGVVSKVYTDKDTRVVRCWEEEQEEEEGERESGGEGEGVGEEVGVEAETVPKKRAHFGWGHRHSFRVTRELLLQLYNHTLEVRLWNTKEKLAPRARFDRPRAFRLPIPTEEEEEEEGQGRPNRFPVVGQETERVGHRRRRKRLSRKTSSNVNSEGESDLDLSASITEVPHSPTKPTASLSEIPEGDNLVVSHEDQSVPTVTNDDQSDQVVTDQSQQTVTTGDEFFTPLDHEKTTDLPHCSTPLPLQVCDSDMSRSKLRRLEAEAAEKARLEREGVVVLRLKMADLFAKQDSIKTKLDSPIDNIKVFEVGVSLESPLMPDSLSRDLNPTVITVHHATNLPTQHLSEQRESCDPAYVQYIFHNLPEHSTSGCDQSHDVTCDQSHDVTWDDSHVILLGTIDRELLDEYLKGAPLVMEVHDRDRRLGREQLDSVFGEEQRDELLGTHAFGAGGRVSEVVRCRIRPWDPFGVARFNLVDLLNGQRIVQLTTPITTGPRTLPSREDCRIGPHGRELPPPLPPGDYSNSYLTITVELSHPLPHPRITPHTLTTVTPSLEEHSAATTCPFSRLVYVTSADESGHILARRILELVNEINTTALGLGELPRDMLTTALSTYKLTKEQMEGGECDVVTGFQVRDSEVSVLVVEGLRHRAIPQMWAQLPRHSSQDPGLLKVFYNSGYYFSRRLYGNLDVDLPLIFLPHSLTTLTKLPPLYIRGAVSSAALRGLLCLSEVSTTSSGGMAELVRNDVFPSIDEITAVALQFGALPGTSAGAVLKCVPEQMHSTTVAGSHTPAAACDGEREEKTKLKVPLDMQNSDYEKLLGDRKGQPPVDYINKNIALTHTLSEQSANLSANRKRRKTRMRSKTDPHTVHIYSAQTFNSAVLAKTRMTLQLGYDQTHQLYTYCQDYHSMTFEPTDVENEKRAQRLADCQKWRTGEGFVYPGVPRLRESNAHPLHPHPGRMEELHEPFADGLLHTNTMKPTVQRLGFRWEQRRDDFNRYYRLPSEFGPSLPVSIHLAGQQRTREVGCWDQLAEREWERKVVVDDTCFYTHRKGACTELKEKTSVHTGRLEDILKDPPAKYSLRRKGLCLKPIPPLDVVRNGDSSCVDREGGSVGGGYQPGLNEMGSLKRDGNMIPLSYQRTHNFSSEGWRGTHTHNFRLYYHTHSPTSKRVILPLSPSERCPPLFPPTTTSPTHHNTAPTHSCT